MISKSALIAAIALFDTSCTFHRMEIKRLAEEDISVYPVVVSAIESDSCSVTLTSESEQTKNWVTCKNWNKLNPQIPFKPCTKTLFAGGAANETLFLPLNLQVVKVLSR